MTSISGKVYYLVMPLGYDKFSFRKGRSKPPGQHRNDEILRAEVIPIDQVDPQLLGL